ncbi:MAG: hypothetical protein Q7T29_05110 [Gallionella sp.]|nr:hypothetical protein [Gallionella sp.]
MQKTLTVRVSQGIYDQVAREAEAKKIGVADFIRAALSERLESDHQAERLAALESRLNQKLDRLQQSVDQLGVEEVSHG